MQHHLILLLVGMIIMVWNMAGLMGVSLFFFLYTFASLFGGLIVKSGLRILVSPGRGGTLLQTYADLRGAMSRLRVETRAQSEALRRLKDSSRRGETSLARCIVGRRPPHHPSSCLPSFCSCFLFLIFLMILLPSPAPHP